MRLLISLTGLCWTTSDRFWHRASRTQSRLRSQNLGCRNKRESMREKKMCSGGAKLRIVTSEHVSAPGWLRASRKRRNQNKKKCRPKTWYPGRARCWQSCPDADGWPHGDGAQFPRDSRARDARVQRDLLGGRISLCEFKKVEANSRLSKQLWVFFPARRVRPRRSSADLWRLAPTA